MVYSSLTDEELIKLADTEYSNESLTYELSTRLKTALDDCRNDDVVKSCNQEVAEILSSSGEGPC